MQVGSAVLVEVLLHKSMRPKILYLIKVMVLDVEGGGSDVVSVVPGHLSDQQLAVVSVLAQNLLHLVILSSIQVVFVVLILDRLILLFVDERTRDEPLGIPPIVQRL